MLETEIINNLEDWFLNSKIYGFNGQYRTYYTKDKIGSVYPEITAYAIQIALYIYKKNDDEKFLERAKDCADYLIKISEGKGLYSNSGSERYVFDTGIYISSLLDLYKLTNVEKYYEESEKSLNWMLTLWDGNTFKPTDIKINNKIWASKSSIHLIKMAIPLLKAYQIDKNIEYKILCEKLLNWGKELQYPEGNFRINFDNKITRTHPHCYATEGYLYAYWYTKNDMYNNIVKKSANWLMNIQNNDGSFYSIYYPNQYFSINFPLIHLKVTDATTQAVRIWKLLGVNKKGIEKGLNYLLNQIEDNGLLLTRMPFVNKFTSRKIFSWPTFFYLQTLLINFVDNSAIEDII